MSDSLNLTPISSCDYGKLYIFEDGDGIARKTIDTLLAATTNQFTEDLRISNGPNSAVNFVLGAYAFREKISAVDQYHFFRDLDQNGDGVVDGADCIAGRFFFSCTFRNSFDQTKTSFAAYGDVKWKITDRIAVRGGLRFTHDKGSLDNFISQIQSVQGVPLANAIPGDPVDVAATTNRGSSGNNLSGKIGLDFQLNPDNLLYASYSRGYRSRAFNAQAFFSPAELGVVKPEIVDAVEAGFKSALFDKVLRVNGALFWYGYKNQQFINIDPVTGITPLVNLPRSRILGGELEVTIKPIEDLEISRGLGIVSTKVIRGVSFGIDIAGKQLTQAPKFTSNFAVDWTVLSGTAGSVAVNGSASYRSREYFDQFNTLTQKGVLILNRGIQIRNEDRSKEIGLWVKNLTNRFYRTAMLDSSTFWFTYTHVNDPRTYGVSLRVNF